MEHKRWIAQLQSTSLKQLCQYKVADFIQICKASFLKPEVINILNALAKNPDIDKPFLWDLYILAFVHRNTSRFEAIVTECQLLQVHERKQEKESAANDSNPFIKAAMNLPALREYKILNLRNEAAYLENRILQLAEKLTNSFVGPKCKRHGIYKSVYDKSLSAKCNVTELLKKISVEQNLTYESLRRGYFRWKNDYASSFIMEGVWPTAEFNYFCALLSVVFLPDNPQASSPLFYFNESIIFEVTWLRKALRESSQDIFINERLKQQYDKLNEDTKNTPQKQKKMIELAGKNYLPAVQYCISNSSPRNGRKYWLQAAILGNTKAQKHCQWKATGLLDIKLDIAAKTKLKLAQTMDSPTLSPIKKGSVIHSIRFDVNINANKMYELISLLKKVKISEPEYLAFGNNDTTVNWQMVSVDATVYNFDILMRHADILPSTVRLCFSSRHLKREFSNNPILHAQIAKLGR